jgi:hypothetical protein
MNRDYDNGHVRNWTPTDKWASRFNVEASRMDCPNGPDEEGCWPCDPQGYFGVMECQICGRVGVLHEDEGLKK